MNSCEKKKNPLYKNWKLYATALGIITICLGVGLGVGLNIHHTSQTTSINLGDIANKNDKKQINNAILQTVGTITSVDIDYAYNKYSDYDEDKTYLIIIIT